MKHTLLSGVGNRAVVPFILVLAAVLVVPASAQSTEERSRAAEQAQRRREESEQRLRRLVAQFTATIRETASLVDRLESSHAAAGKRRRELMTNDDGKRIGRDPATILGLVRSEDDPIVTADQISARKSAIQSVLAGMENELKRDAVGYLPEDATRREADEILYWTRDRLSRLTEQEAWLDTLIGKAPRDIDLKQEPTLEDRIRRYRAEVRQAANDAALRGAAKGQDEGREKISEAARVAALEKAQTESERLLREARAENERMKLDYELRLKQLAEQQAREAAQAEIRYKDAMAELERAKKAADAKRVLEDTEADAKAREVVAEAEKVRLRARCEDPEVLRRLAPFVTPGYYQPKGKGTEKKPMSLKGLIEINALGTDRNSLRELWRVANRRENDRPHFNLPDHFNWRLLTEDQIEELRAARDDLHELGPTLVELGKLSP